MIKWWLAGFYLFLSFSAAAESFNLEVLPAFEAGYIHHTTTLGNDADKTGTEFGLGALLRWHEHRGDWDLGALLHFYDVRGSKDGVNQDMQNIYFSATFAYNYWFMNSNWALGPMFRFRDGDGAKYDYAARKVMTPVFSIGPQGKYRLPDFHDLEIGFTLLYDVNSTTQTVYTLLVQAAIPMWNW